MGYGSDLDIVFLHDCDALQNDTRGGKRKLANETWLSRLGQRIVSALSTQTAAGRAYEVDLELRPDGRRGLTVSSLAGFAHYQRSSAWVWEHQALTRARPVAGEAPLREGFTQLRHEVLTRERDANELRSEVREMREKMRRHLDKAGAGRFSVKQGEGGLTDIEFITQYLVLRHAHVHPALVEWSDNWRQAEALVAAKILTPGQASVLVDTYREYRAFLHQCDLQQAEPMADDSRFTAARDRVRALWQETLGEGS
jgi:glutamate-ammonia-ligase adenylyltransferase